MEEPLNFPGTIVLSVIWKDRWSEHGRRTHSGPQGFFHIIFIMKGVARWVLIYLHPSPYWALKLSFLRYIGGLNHDGTIDKEMDFGSMSQTVGVLTPGMFSQSTHPL